MQNISEIVKKIEDEILEAASCYFKERIDKAVMLGEMKSYYFVLRASDGQRYYCNKEFKEDRPVGHRNIVTFSRMLKR